MNCIEDDDVAGLRELLKAGANANSGFSKEVLMITDLIDCAIARDAETKRLLRVYEAYNVMSQHTDTAIRLAVANENIEIVKML